MADYLDVISFRERGDGQKPFAAKIGSAKVREDGSIDIWFDALPAPSLDRNGKLQTHVRVSQRREKPASGGYTPGPRQARMVTQEELDDEIPFR